MRTELGELLRIPARHWMRSWRMSDGLSDTGSQPLIEWQTGEPSKHGYYIGAWRRGDRLLVSELWFNPDATPHWWFARGYTGLDVRHGQHYAVRSEVVAWMSLPDPPRDE